jgi:hypothetical protein
MSDNLNLLLLAAVAYGSYLAACMIWPWRDCVRCKGEKKFMSPLRRGFRTCPHCDGSGKQLRMGRRTVRFIAGRRARKSVR